MMEPQVLRPWIPEEAMEPAAACRLANCTSQTIRSWCSLHDIGRKVAGRWKVSRVALAMFLDGETKALSLYLAGDRTSEAVLAYFRAASVPLHKVNTR